MRPFANRSWDGFSDAMLSVGGYVLLVTGTVLSILLGDADPASRADDVGHRGRGGRLDLRRVHAAAAAAPGSSGPARLSSGSASCVLASILMLRQPLFFIFMIAGFFYASVLRPFAVAVAAIAVTSILVNSLIAGLPQTASAWTFWFVIIVVQTVVLSAGTFFGERVAEQNEVRRETVARLERALAENAGLHAQLLAQAREAGVLEERQRMAARDPRHDRPGPDRRRSPSSRRRATSQDRPDEHDRHLANAERLARESLSEARRSVEGSLPAPLEAATLPDALREVAREWSERTRCQPRSRSRATR